jgi:flagellum-specific peptidoglycan hydrolase FlgJ
MIPLSRVDFIKKYDTFITNLLLNTGILKGTLYSQAIIESSTKPTYLVGSSVLSKQANNLFGIKANKGYKGNFFIIQTREQKPNGENYFVDAKFRKYNSVEDSIKDYVLFLQENKRYRDNGFFQAKTVKEQADVLQKSGYATDKNYSTLIDSVYNSIKKNFKDTIKNVTPSKILPPILLFALLLSVYKYVNN